MYDMLVENMFVAYLTSDAIAYVYLLDFPSGYFLFHFSSYKYIQGKFGLPESTPDRQVFKN